MFIFELYHQNSKHRYTVPKDIPDHSTWPDDWKTVFLKKYERFPTVELPKPLAIEQSLSASLLKRSSSRNLKQQITVEALSSLLFYSLGEKPDSNGNRRMYPSAGARFPLEFYLFVLSDIDHIKQGLYHYQVEDNNLRHIFDTTFTEEFYSKSTINQELYGAQCLLVCTASLSRSSMKYGERAYRFVHLEAGATLQNVSLTATGLNLQSVALGGATDDYLEKLLDIDGAEESIIYTIGLG